jgi:hypothetical protein
MQQSNFLLQMIKRWGSKNPRFWKIITTVAAIMMALIFCTLGLEKYQIFTLPVNWHDLLTHLETFFTGVMITGGLGTQDPNLMDDKTVQTIKKDDTIR